MTKFTDFAFCPELQKAIDEAGFREPSPIQTQSIPLVLEGRDLVGQAQTGTGKTAAFGLPMLELLSRQGNLNQYKNNVAAVVLVPTRELAIQVSEELSRFSQFLGLKTATVYGGQPYSAQIRAMHNSPIVVATPGRFIDHLSSGKFDLKPRFVVLDEADEMLNMGFLEDIRKIFSYFPDERQNLLFSATLPPSIKKLIGDILHQPEYVTLSRKNITAEHIEQSFYVVDEHERDDALIRLYDALLPTKSIIFCRTKKEVDRLAYFLTSQGHEARGLHGDMEQKNREAVILSFRQDKLEVLVATDVAARGLDVNDVSHVFNYHLPFDTESYVHRIGRTGRAGKSGMAISIVTPHEYRGLQRINEKLGGSLLPKTVPHSHEIRNKKISSFIEALYIQEIDERAYEILEVLKEEMELSTVAFKLISMLKDQVEVRGKAQIGKSEKELERLMSRPRYDRHGQNGKGGPNRYKQKGGQYRGKNSSYGSHSKHRSRG
ncbi:DEAD/DEAH box helicase [Candidatus Haliotispira prima]|uniref:DEAD/DEAH box helicase n=1 Tax=Candidatus Haliotispira prima TaxID=3034016 RepID=A0ABY8MLX3_9SPIO|nr:DEAD/DEAH box helicase [Candidatus Haliotispira prima]